MIKVGKYNTLKVLRKTSVGMFLGLEDDEGILLPNKYIPPRVKVGDEIEVFIYKDNEARLIASTYEAKIQLNEFACLQVKEITTFGAFLDWGMPKDLLVPFREQAQKMEAGEWYVVYLYEDDQTERFVASSKLKNFFQKELTVKEGDEVDLLIGEPTDLGYKVVINNLHEGLLFTSEVFKRIKLGDKVKGFIKKIRPDNKIDVSLQQQGYVNIEPNAQKILDLLKKNEGFLKLNDKSDPEEIKYRLEMSKKTFKKAIGALYKQKIIRIEQDGIYLNQNGDNE